MVLVVGATGRLGSKIAKALVGQGKQVRILVRESSAFQELAALGMEVAVGDLRNPESLEAACRGIETVVTTANSARRTGNDNVETVDRLGTRALIDAARGAGVLHFVYVSVLGVSAQSPVPFLAAKGSNEAHLRASGMAWTILAPNAFMESWPAVIVGAPALKGQPIVLVGEGRRRHTFVAEDNVASFAVAAVGNPKAMNKHLSIGGPDPLSWRDVVQVYERVLGRPLAVQFVEPSQAIPGVPPPVQGFLTLLDTFESVFDTAEPARAFGVKLTPLEEVARRQAAQAQTSTPSTSSGPS